MPRSAYLLEEMLWLEVGCAEEDAGFVADGLAGLWPDGWATGFWYCLPLPPQGDLERGGAGEPALAGRLEPER